MNQPMQLSGNLRLINQQPLSALLTFGAVLIFPLLLSSCAQLNQLMGTPAESTETAQPATVTAPSAGPAHKAASTHAPKVSHEQPSHAPAATPSHPTPSATNAQPARPDSKQAHDKAVAEKEQPKKDKKANVASDKKSGKKPLKPEAQPPSEDVFLPPIPLPSKPAAIGGSGG